MKKVYFLVIHNKKYKTWSIEDDQLLLKLIPQNKSRNKWKNISKIIGKTVIDCIKRFKLINPNFKKGLWTQEEDFQVINLSKIYGKNWAKIASGLPHKNRTGKQIRQRYLNFLDPKINREKFSVEEDIKILELFETYKTNWRYYTKHLINRTADMIKGRYYSSVRYNVKVLNILDSLNYSNKIGKGKENVKNVMPSLLNTFEKNHKKDSYDCNLQLYNEKNKMCSIKNIEETNQILNHENFDFKIKLKNVFKTTKLKKSKKININLLNDSSNKSSNESISKNSNFRFFYKKTNNLKKSKEISSIHENSFKINCSLNEESSINSEHKYFINNTNEIFNNAESEFSESINANTLNSFSFIKSINNEIITYLKQNTLKSDLKKFEYKSNLFHISEDTSDDYFQNTEISHNESNSLDSFTKSFNQFTDDLNLNEIIYGKKIIHNITDFLI